MKTKRYLVEIEVDETKVPFSGELWSRSEPNTEEVFEVDVISAREKITAAFPAGRSGVSYCPRPAARGEH